VISRTRPPARRDTGCLPRAFIEQLADKVTEGFRGDAGVVPRQFLRTFANILDIVATDPEQDPYKLLGFEPKDLSPEERAVMAGRALEAPGDGDEFGGGAVEM
jgi:hypothetical protein